VGPGLGYDHASSLLLDDDIPVVAVTNADSGMIEIKKSSGQGNLPEAILIIVLQLVPFPILPLAITTLV
jgi:hypothetical protein